MQTAINSVSTILGLEFERCESPSLRLEKFVNITPGKKTERTRELENVILSHKKYARRPMIYNLNFPRQRKVYACLKGNLIVNQSGGILENAGLCLDSFRSFPYLPGSAVKGVASLAAFREWEKVKTEALAREIVEVFGYPTNHSVLDRKLVEWDAITFKKMAYSGKVCFMAGIPCSQCELTLDIATPHHMEYYRGDRPSATDDEAPVPLAFPAVKGDIPEKSEFLFRLIPLEEVHETVLANAQKWLESALTQFGVGAKTAAGYGWFEIGRDSVVEERERLKAEREKQEQDAKEFTEKQRQLAEELKAQAIKVQQAALETERATPFSKMSSKNWKLFSSDVTRIFKLNNESFSFERRMELLEVICNCEKIKNKDLQGGVKSLNKWLGEELTQELYKRRGINGNS